MMDMKRFDQACHSFTLSMRCVADWKNHYFGAAYTTRLRQAVNEAELALEIIKRVIEEDDKS